MYKGKMKVRKTDKILCCMCIVGVLILFAVVVNIGYKNTSNTPIPEEEFYITHTGYVTEIEFIHPYIMLIKFDDGHRLGFEHYNLQVPEQENVTFIYHEGYMFDSKNPIYILDDFTVNE